LDTASTTVPSSATSPPTSSVAFAVTLDIWPEIALIGSEARTGATTAMDAVLTVPLAVETLWTVRWR
jgi:hypothetical protein